MLSLLGGCVKSQDANTVKGQKSEYYDVLSFVKELSNNTKNHPLKKWTFEDGTLDEVVLTKPDYSRELALFLTSDIQKPAWQGLFTEVKDGALTSYTATTDKPDVKLLVIRRDSTGRIVELDVTQEQDNYLFKSKSFGSLFVVYENEKPRVDSLNLQGDQRIIFGSTYSYNLLAKVK